MATRKAKTVVEADPELIDDIDVSSELSDSFLSYAMSVIVSRALPDARDGMKPVHRRILYSMRETGLRPDAGYVKSARVVGNVMGRYHPHGDAAIYAAMVRLAQDFQMSVPLVDGHGNFGTLTDSAAASRYCLPASARVRQGDGTWIRIGELVGIGSAGDVHLDTVVCGADGAAVRAVKGFCSGQHRVLTAVGANGHTVTGTVNHPVWARRGDAVGWATMGQLQTGDRLLFAPPLPTVPGQASWPGTATAERGVPESVWSGPPAVQRAWLDAVVAGAAAGGGVVAVRCDSAQAASELQRLATVHGVAAHRDGPWDGTVTFGGDFGDGDDIVNLVDGGVTAVFSVKVDSVEHAFIADEWVHHNTEARMTAASMLMTDGLEEDTVDMVDNYDGRLKEPAVLPAAFPNLLVNGTNGIAVGMSTRILPHNLRDVTRAAVALLRDRSLTASDLADIVGGPDLPSGGVLYGTAGARASYVSGRGQVTVGPAEETVVDARGRAALVFTALPYQVSAEQVMERINELMRDGRLPDVVRVADLTDRIRGMRLVVDLRKGADVAKVRAYLHRNTPVRASYHLHHLALFDGVPVTATLKELLTAFVDHRLEVVTRRTRFRRDKAAARLHIVDGLLIALRDIDRVVSIIRAAKDTAAAKAGLVEAFTMSDVQVLAVLEMPLRRLTSLETSTLAAEADSLRRTIAELEAILGDEALLIGAVCAELDAVASAHGNDRRTLIVDADDLPSAAGADTGDGADDGEPRLLVLDGQGAVHAFAPPSAGSPAKTSPEAVVALYADRGPVAWFTDTGHMVYTKLSALPEPGTSAAADSIIDLDVDEKVVGAAIPAECETVVFVTSTGKVKRMDPGTLPKRSASVMRVDDNEKVVAVFAANPSETVLVATDTSMVWRVEVAKIPVKGAAAGGVAGMRLGDGDRILCAGPVTAGTLLSTVTDSGDVHTAPGDDFPAKGRGTGGVRGHRLRASASTLTQGWLHVGGELYVATARTVKARPDKVSTRGRSGSPAGGRVLWWPTRNWVEPGDG